MLPPSIQASVPFIFIEHVYRRSLLSFSPLNTLGFAQTFVSNVITLLRIKKLALRARCFKLLRAKTCAVWRSSIITRELSRQTTLDGMMCRGVPTHVKRVCKCGHEWLFVGAKPLRCTMLHALVWQKFKPRDLAWVKSRTCAAQCSSYQCLFHCDHI